MNFEIFHSYMKLARRGYCTPLTCRHCSNEQTVMRGDDDEPRLHCFYCGVTVTPGLNMYDQMVAIVKEHII